MNLLVRVRAVKHALADYQRAVRRYDAASRRDGTSPQSDATRFEAERAAGWLAEAVAALLGST